MSTLRDLAPIIYVPWPRDVINEAVSEFNHQMHDGAGVPEIEAGLHGLDFLCRRSEIDDDLQARLDGCITEAGMRIELLALQESEQRSQDERFKLAATSIRNLQKQAELILRRARTMGGDYLSARYETFDDDNDD